MSRTRLPAMFAAAILALVSVGGCRNTHLDFDLRPEGEKLRRQFTFSASSGTAADSFEPWDRDSATRIAALYGAEVPEDLAREHQFVSTFGPRLPDETGSSGWYLYWPTQMGSLHTYAELFGDNGDLAADLDASLLVVDRFVETIDLYLRTEFAPHPANERFIAAWNGPVREDLRNATLHAWVGSISDAAEFRGDALAIRLAHYFSARGWFDPRELPQLARLVFSLPESDSDWNSDNLRPLASLGLRAVARRAGFGDDDPLPPLLQAAEADILAFSDSLSAFAQDPAATRGLVDRWLQDGGRPEGADSVAPLSAAAFLNLSLDFMDFGVGNDHLSVRLLLGEEPLATNGRLHDDGSVSWRQDIGGTANTVPISLYAIWVDPANDYQLSHFGKIVLAGEDLANYALWYNGLTGGEKADWDALLDSLTPESDIDEQLERFRFGDDPDSPAQNRQGFPID